MSRTRLPVAVLLAVATALVLAMAVSAGFISLRAPNGALAGSDHANTVIVIGDGHASASPDMMIVQLGVSMRRGSVREAMTAADAGIGKMIEVLKANGIKATDIQTSMLSVNPNWENGRITGYTAGNTVRLTIRDLPRAHAIIGSAAEATGNETQLGGISFGRQDNTAQLKAAREAALASANTRAAEWTRLAGRRLGKIQSVSEVIAPSQQPVGQYGNEAKREMPTANRTPPGRSTRWASRRARRRSARSVRW